MEPTGFKLKSEVIFEPVCKGKKVKYKTTILYDCNGEKCESCRRDVCHQTSDVHYAKHYNLFEK